MYFSWYLFHRSDQSALLLAQTWHRLGDKPLPLPKATCIRTVKSRETLRSSIQSWMPRYTYKHMHDIFRSVMNHDFKHSAVPLQHGQFLPVSSQQTHRSSPVGARYRSSVVSLESDLSFATFIIVSYGMSCKNWTALQRHSTVLSSGTGTSFWDK